MTRLTGFSKPSWWRKLLQSRLKPHRKQAGRGRHAVDVVRHAIDAVSDAVDRTGARDNSVVAGGLGLTGAVIALDSTMYGGYNSYESAPCGGYDYSYGGGDSGW